MGTLDCMYEMFCLGNFSARGAKQTTRRATTLRSDNDLRSLVTRALFTENPRSGWLGFNGTSTTQVAAISCLRKFKVH